MKNTVFHLGFVLLLSINARPSEIQNLILNEGMSFNSASASLIVQNNASESCQDLDIFSIFECEFGRLPNKAKPIEDKFKSRLQRVIERERDLDILKQLLEHPINAFVDLKDLIEIRISEIVYSLN